MLDQSPISLSAHTLALEVTFVIAAPLLNLTSLSAVMVKIKKKVCVHFYLRNFHFLEYKIGIYDRVIICLRNIPLFTILFLQNLSISLFRKTCYPKHLQ